MINKLADFVNIVTNSQGIYLYYTDDVCEAAVEYLRDNNGCDKIKAILAGTEETKESLCGIEIKNINDISLNKEIPVIVTARKNHQIDTEQSLLQYGFRQIEQMDEDFAFYLLKKLKNKNRGNSTEFLIDKMRDQLLRFVPRPYLEYLVINILDHCNLKCKGCDHFACIADPYLVPFQTLHNDIERMAEIMHGDNIMKIGVMGGEPLLHPDLLEILKDVRNNFPNAIIRLTTNGLLLLQQKEDFWAVCRDYNITIVNTKYPIKIDHEKMKEKAESESVKFQFYEGTGDDTVKTSFKKIITLDGTNDPVKSFAKCHCANWDNFLMEGKLYSCAFSCQSYRIFNKKFEQNLRMTEGDYLDIYKVQDMQEILEFAARPRPYCRYCSDLDRWHEWERSKQDISEWV